jgi:hypothetical protein
MHKFVVYCKAPAMHYSDLLPIKKLNVIRDLLF